MNSSPIPPLLRQLEQTRHIYWNIPPEVGFFLNSIIKDRNYKTVLEIGTSNGYSGIWLAEALSHTGGMLYTIESHKKERYRLATENFKKSGLTPYITQILGHAPEAIPATPETFDLAFFDATKYEHIDYFNAVKNRINRGGMIITDNIDSHEKDLQLYKETVLNTQKFQTFHYHIGTGLLISYFPKENEQPDL